MRTGRPKRFPTGQCVTCGEPAAPTYKHCEACLDKRCDQKTKAAAQRAKRWRQAGLCFHCGRERKPGYLQCEIHVQQHAEQTRKRWMRPEHKERVYFTAIKRNFGLSRQEYEQLLLMQGRACAICRWQPHQDGRQHLHVDHDHETGRVRGLLCTGCNTMLGRMGDDPALFARAISYLLNAKSETKKPKIPRPISLALFR